MSCYFCFCYCLLGLNCGECNVIPCIFCIALSMDLFVLCVACLTRFMNFVVELIRNIFGCGCYFVVECGGGALLDRPCMAFQRIWLWSVR